jgi:DNA-binding NarL/FixJ family response regulator
MTNIRFLVVEKSFIIRQGIKTILHDLSNAELIEAADYSSPLENIIEQIRPSVIIFNHKLLKQQPDIYQILKAAKENVKLVLIKGPNKKLDNEKFFDLCIDIDSAKSQIIKELNDLIEELKSNQIEETSDLSDREIDVLKLVAKGKSNKEMADMLFISTHTVISHRKNIIRKLNIKSVAGLTVYAILNRLISEDELNNIS